MPCKAQEDPWRKGIIFNIQRYSIHDGPGIRTLVFLKGCPLHCLWCSNPESQAHGIEMMFFGDRCTSCTACLEACPGGARRMEKGLVSIDRDRCRVCGRCADICMNSAVKMAGSRVSVEDVLDTIEQDRMFYDESGGGVTLSGGEPGSQSDFAAAILERCREKMISTAIETSGACPWPDLKKLIDHCDLVLYDIKHAEPEKHRRLTGAGNHLIKDNALRAAKSEKEMIVRVPLIPGINDDAENLEAICRFVKSLETVREVHLLPYHEYGRVKYRRLGRSYPLVNHGGLDPDDIKITAAKEIMKAAGFVVEVGG
jgi:pyruvate formate lyase activating enzyme